MLGTVLFTTIYYAINLYFLTALKMPLFAEKFKTESFENLVKSRSISNKLETHFKSGQDH